MSAFPVHRQTFFRLLVVFASIFALGAIAFALPSLGGRMALPLLPSGVAVAAAYRWGRRMWPAIFAAGLAIDLMLRQPWIASVGVGVGLAGGAWLTALLLEFNEFKADFSRAKDVPVFIFAVAVGMTLAPTFGLLGFYFSGSTTATDPINWIRWWANAAAGALLWGPIWVALNRKSFSRFLQHWTEGALWLLALAIVCGITVQSREASFRPLIVVFANVLIVVSAIRFGLVVALCASSAISIATACSAAFGIGLYAQADRLQGLVVIWSFIAALSGLSLIITALLAERDSASQQRLHAEHRYEQVFNGSPQPLWVCARDTFRFLLINDAAISQYGWNREELLTQTVDVLALAGKQPLPSPSEDAIDTPDLGPEPFETQHLTKNGRVLDVEVWTRLIDYGGQAAELVFAVDVTERRAFGQALMDAIGGEQSRIAQEVHDGLGQELTGLALSLRALTNRAQRERDAISVDLDQLALLATRCIQDAHQIVQGLSPLTNADGDLDAALGSLAQRCSLSGVRVGFRSGHDGEPIMPLKVRNHLYRIAQEAVQNALKHSGATSIEIELRSRAGGVRLSVTDDGRGVSPDAVAGTGLGMRTMRFRASAIGARISITCGANGGNSVVCDAPLKPLLVGNG
jgi:PAS domain S-box-containing protein